MNAPLHIDGSQGEGGGQVLRSSLALSAITGRPVHLTRIRAGRAKPGLARQHLTAVRAVAEVCGAEVRGDAIGSTELRFSPGPIRSGDRHVAIGTAGSTGLVLQAMLWPLMRAEGPSRVVLEGGTHNPLSPPFDFLVTSFAPAIARMGFQLAVSLDRHGFYPAGGGRITAEIRPTNDHRPLEWTVRGSLRTIQPRVVLSRLPASIAHRELASLAAHLQLGRPYGAIEQARDPVGPGNALHVEVVFEHGTALFTAFGEKTVSAEDVGAAAAAEVSAFLPADVPVDPHLADQLLIPMALAGGGVFRTTEPTEHTRTNAEVIARFLPVRFELVPQGGPVWEIRCAPVGA